MISCVTGLPFWILLVMGTMAVLGLLTVAYTVVETVNDWRHDRRLRARYRDRHYWD